MAECDGATIRVHMGCIVGKAEFAQTGERLRGEGFIKFDNVDITDRKISKRGNKQLRTLLIVGATSILKQARRGSKLPGWVVSLMARRPYKVAAVALANKMARTIWALLVKGGTYQAPAMAKA